MVVAPPVPAFHDRNLHHGREEEVLPTWLVLVAVPEVVPAATVPFLSPGEFGHPPEGCRRNLVCRACRSVMRLPLPGSELVDRLDLGYGTREKLPVSRTLDDGPPVAPGLLRSQGVLTPDEVWVDVLRPRSKLGGQRLAIPLAKLRVRPIEVKKLIFTGMERVDDVGVAKPVCGHESLITCEEADAVLHHELSIKSNRDGPSGSRACQLPHLRLPGWRGIEVDVGSACRLRIAPQNQAELEDALGRPEVAGVVKDSREASAPLVSEFRVPHCPGVLAGKVLSRGELLVKGIQIRQDRLLSVFPCELVVVSLHSPHPQSLIRQSFPGCFPQWRGPNHHAESAGVVVPDANHHLPGHDIGDPVIQMPDQGIEFHRQVNPAKRRVGLAVLECPSPKKKGHFLRNGYQSVVSVHVDLRDVPHVLDLEPLALLLGRDLGIDLPGPRPVFPKDLLLLRVFLLFRPGFPLGVARRHLGLRNPRHRLHLGLVGRACSHGVRLVSNLDETSRLGFPHSVLGSSSAP